MKQSSNNLDAKELIEKINKVKDTVEISSKEEKGEEKDAKQEEKLKFFKNVCNLVIEEEREEDEEFETPTKEEQSSSDDDDDDENKTIVNVDMESEDGVRLEINEGTINVTSDENTLKDNSNDNSNKNEEDNNVQEADCNKSLNEELSNTDSSGEEGKNIENLDKKIVSVVNHLTEEFNGEENTDSGEFKEVQLEQTDGSEDIEDLNEKRVTVSTK